MHVRNAIAAVAPERYRQETNYTSALLNRLEGTAYDGRYGSVVFQSTVFDDRGPNSAERRYGADHAVTATISDGTTTIQKAILIQAKLGRVDNLTSGQISSLRDQIRRMGQLVAAPKVMEIPEVDGRRIPAIISGTKILRGQQYKPMELPKYFVARITTTLDGSTDPKVVAAVKDSSLDRLNVTARVRA